MFSRSIVAAVSALSLAAASGCAVRSAGSDAASEEADTVRSHMVITASSVEGLK
jgi:hypothetical protein